MYTMGSLAVKGHGNMAVPNTFFGQGAGAHELAVIYPGLSYRCSAPLLWYPTRFLVSRGADVLWVEYAYDAQTDWARMDGRAQRDRLSEDSAAAFRAAMGEGEYERVVLVGKSLGTLAMESVFASERLPEATKAVWMTPVLTDGDLRKRLESMSSQSLVVMGTADHYYDKAALAELGKNRRLQVLTIDGADHLLETKDGAVRSIDVLRRVMESVERFVSE